LFYCKPPDVDVELIVDLDGWRYVEPKFEQRSHLSKNKKLEYVMEKELYYANKGIR